MSNILFDLLIKYHQSLVSRDFIIDYFVESDFMTKDETIKSKMVKLGKLFQDDGKLYVVTEAISKSNIGAFEEIPFPEKKLSFYNRFHLKRGMIENFNEDTQIVSTLGIYILNFLVLVKPFENIISYVNDYWKLGNIEKDIVDKALNGFIKPEQIYKYIDYVFFLSSLTDFCTPSVTERCITPNPEVTQRRLELFEKYKDQLDDPNIMIMIEDELIKLDKKLLADDDSSGLMIKGKNFDVQRKRMFTMFGLSETFGDDTQGYDFGKFNLNDGWDLKEMDVIANDIRRGSYNRAKSTALGGYESKVLGRNFQDSSIVADDCGTKRGINITLTKDNISAFYHHTILNKNGNKYENIILTKDNESDFLNKEVVIRSPMYCTSTYGYCYACMDSRFKELGVKLLSVGAVGIGSTFLSNSLRAMHGSKASIFDLNNLNKIVI